jgi:ATP-dependent Lhr-like helicase
VDGAALARFLPGWQGIGATAKGSERLLEALAQLAGLPLPWSELDRVLLPARVPGYRSQDLDLLAASGLVVWVGRGALGPKDGRIALYRRDSIAALEIDWPGAQGPGAQGSGTERCGTECSGAERATGGPGPLGQALIDRLGRGACFLTELAQAAEITNDTFAPLRALAGGTRAGRRGREPALAGGRWSLVADLGSGVPGEAAARETRRTLALARQLLDRYGVVSRESVQSEGVPGGFGPLYRVLKSMEESGQVRRGWFVEGLSGAQFALPGAVERLRAARVDEPPVDGLGPADLLALAAMDPANPYGALLPWPEPGGGGSPRRAAGAWVILVAGRPILYLGPGGRSLQTFPASMGAGGNALSLALAGLAGLRTPGRRRLLIRRIDGVPALGSPLRGALLAAGFEPDCDALVPAPPGIPRPPWGRTSA